MSASRLSMALMMGVNRNLDSRTTRIRKLMAWTIIVNQSVSTAYAPAVDRK